MVVQELNLKIKMFVSWSPFTLMVLSYGIRKLPLQTGLAFHNIMKNSAIWECLEVGLLNPEKSVEVNQTPKSSGFSLSNLVCFDIPKTCVVG